MSSCISIGAAHHQELLKNRLNRELLALEGRGLRVRLREKPLGWLTFLDCSISGSGGMKTIIRRRVAGVITEMILDNWEETLLKHIIRENYYYFNDDEKGAIYDYAQKKLNFSANNRKNDKLLILQRLTEYLDAHSNINIDGFIRFRLKEYVDGLYSVADQAADDFIMEREYKEFIELLKYFVEIQDPRVELVNVVLQSNGSFKLYDQQNQPINSDYLEDFMLNITENEINYEDMLISALITVAPQKILFHPGNGAMPHNTLDTVSNVFTGRVSICEGCSLCRQTGGR
ncbi:MAG: putative sporulation protein YtxC [Firmicutes bacterium]|nr:putative sporulation protein YtxC [Bacillota bacterium]